MLQKIWASILIAIFTLWNISVTFADQVSPEYMKAKILAEKTTYEKYVSQLETIIPSLTSEKLIEIKQRAQNGQKSSNSTDLNNFLNFVETLIQDELSMRSDSWKIIPTTTTPVVPKEEEEISPISDSDKAQAEQEILILQKTAADWLIDMLESVTVIWENMSHREEKWDFSMQLEMNIPDFMKYSLGVKINDYIAETQLLDQTFTGNTEVDVMVESYYENFGGSFSGDVELISKDWVFYLKVDNVETNTSEELEIGVEPFLKILKGLSDENTYISFEDEDALFALEALQWISISNVEKIIQEASDVPMFEAYDKVDGKFLLQPTKEFCSFAKATLAIFDPFNGDTCSDRQYENMLEDFRNGTLSFQLTPGKNKNLLVTLRESDAYGELSIDYSQYGLISISGSIVEPGNENVNNVSFNFIPKKEFNFDAKIEEMITSSLRMSLNSKNTITQADLDLTIYDEYSEWSLVAEAIYSGGKLSASAQWKFDDTEISCEWSGKLSSNKWNFSGDCDISNKDYWSEEIQEFKTNINWEYDLSGTKNNIEVDMSMLLDENDFFSFNIKNTGTKKQVKARTINKPTKVINYEEIESELYGYDDYYEGNDGCYTIDGFEYCDVITDEYYYDAYNNTYYYDDYEYNATSWEYYYYEY